MTQSDNDKDKQLETLGQTFGEKVKEEDKNVDYVGFARQSDANLLRVALVALNDLQTKMEANPKKVLPAALRKTFLKLAQEMQDQHRQNNK